MTGYTRGGLSNMGFNSELRFTVIKRSRATQPVFVRGIGRDTVARSWLDFANLAWARSHGPLFLISFRIHIHQTNLQLWSAKNTVRKLRRHSNGEIN